VTSADVIAAIRRQHLKANIDREPPRTRRWAEAWVDPGGTIFGSGPYVKLPLADGRVIRVHPPARLRRQLAARWSQDGDA
jgi:hypothetical protein